MDNASQPALEPMIAMKHHKLETRTSTMLRCLRKRWPAPEGLRHRLHHRHRTSLSVDTPDARSIPSSLVGIHTRNQCCGTPCWPQPCQLGAVQHASSTSDSICLSCPASALCCIITSQSAVCISSVSAMIRCAILRYKRGITPAHALCANGSPYRTTCACQLLESLPTQSACTERARRTDH